MKKLIILLFITTLLSSCGRDPIKFDEGAIITDIENYDNYCVYYSRTTRWFEFISIPKGYFCDKCGKFNIGDTIILTKQ